MSFPGYPRYCESGVRLLGPVPNHWKVVPVKVVATCNDEVLDESTAEDFEIEYVEISDVDAIRGITGSSHMRFGDAPSRARRRVRSGDVLVSTVRTYLRAVAPVSSPPDNMIASTGFAVIRPRSVDSRFLGYMFLAEFFISEVIARSTGVSYPAINASDLMRFKVPLPPIAEQISIAIFLDREIAKIDALIAEQERMVELLKEKLQAVISQAVTKGLNPAVPMKPVNINWLESIPSHWKLMQVKHLARADTGSFIDGDWIEAPYITDDGVRLIQTGNIGIGVFKEQGFRYISDDTFGTLRCTAIMPRDVLICRLDGPVGRACLAPDLGVRMITSVDNAILKVAEGVHPEFVVALFSSVPWLSWIDAICRVGGGFRLRISRSQLGEQRVPLPPPDEQGEIARRLSAQAVQSAALESEARRTIGLLTERRSALISAAVTGQIDVRGLAEEKAA